MEREERDELVGFAKRQFAFLKTEKGFTKPLISRPDYALLVYRNATMGVRIEMDVYLSLMEIMLVKLGVSGSFPFGNDGGQRTVWLLQSFLVRQLAVRDERMLALDEIDLATRRKKQDSNGDFKWGSEDWKRVIGLYQGLLRDYVDLILQQPLEGLFPTDVEYLSMWSTREAIEQFACEQLAFLGEYGFQTRPVFAMAGWFAIYTWMGTDRGVQLVLNYRDMDVDCKMVRLIDGKIPTTNKHLLKRYDYFVRGGETAVPLVVLLKRFGIAMEEVEGLRDVYSVLDVRHWSDCDYRYVRTFIVEYANLVRHYIKFLTQDKH